MRNEIRPRGSYRRCLQRSKTEYNTTKSQDLPEKRRLPSRHAHTHNIYAVRRVKAPGPSEHASEASPLAGISPVSFSATRLVISNPLPPSPPLLFPQISLLKRRGRSGAHSTPPLSGESTVHGRHGACVARQAHRRSVAGPPPPPTPPHTRTHRDCHMQKAGYGREQLP